MPSSLHQGFQNSQFSGFQTPNPPIIKERLDSIKNNLGSNNINNNNNSLNFNQNGIGQSKNKYSFILKIFFKIIH